MSLSDIVASAGLAIYAEAALVLFFAAFVAVLFQMNGRRPDLRYRDDSALPLRDDDGASGALATVRATPEAKDHGR